MRNLWRHLQFGIRLFRKNPGFTAAAVIALALAIGANTAIFSVVYATLLAPLPYRQPVAGELLFRPGFLRVSGPATILAMRNLIVLFIHFIATLTRLLGPGGVRSLVAESLLLKHQLLIVNRSRQRSPNLSASDRILTACWHSWCVRLVCSVPQSY